MSTDNPSYFVVPNGTLPCNKSKFRLFKKKTDSNSSQDFISEVSTFNGGTANRIPLRTLLRSVSSNSADSNQELLVLGEPRPSDIAPPSPCLSSHKEDSNRKFTKQKEKSKLDLITNGLVYSPLATSEEAADDIFYSDGEEEVFLTEDSAKYYNVSTNRATGRRHSIGTYLLQERERTLSVASSSKSFREDLPQATIHATIDGKVIKPSSVSFEIEHARCAKHSRRRCLRCRGAGNSANLVNMDDIVIISSKQSQAAALWVNYFGTCFDQISRQKNRPHLKVFKLGVEEVDETGVNYVLEQRLSSVKLNVVIVCPQLLNYVAADPKSSAVLCNLLKPDRTIAMLLGVTDDDLTDVHYKALVSYKQWKRHQVGQDQDQDFARDFLSTAMGILTKIARQQHAALLEERATFSVMPKKVKQSQNRLVVLLTDPLAKDDIIRISVDRNGDMVEVKTVKKRNPYTLKFTMPDCCLEVSSIVNVVVEKNGDILGTRPVKCESRLRELDQILRSINDPIEFMCQTLGFNPSNTEQLDIWMVQAFQKNLPPHFNLISNGNGSIFTRSESDSMKHPHAHEEFPTLLHFAAKYNLEKLSWQLLECPGAEVACELRNASDLTPSEIAESAGHSKLASALKGYMQMNEFTNMYSKLKELSLTKQAPPDVDDEEYLLPRPADMYSVPPPARPYSPANQSSNSLPLTGYLEMQPANKVNLPGRRTPVSNAQSDQVNTRSSSKAPTPLPTEHPENRPANGYEDKVQGELLEIINDFKNNVFSLSEVEQLVENWKKRNDVQKSFKEKEEQLNLMRKEYERLQQLMKEEMKRPTPFDRIKRLFGKKSKKAPNQIANITKDIKLETSLINENKTLSDFNLSNGQSQLRPISSLSLQSTASTSSSGRMSILSGCSATSFGDSGVHSDHEDRKHLMRETSNDHQYFEIVDPKKSPLFTYLIPPAPKPVYKYGTVKQHNSQITTIDERPPHPTPREETSAEGDQYYIQFPPSGLPVSGNFTNNQKQKSRSPSPMVIPEESINEYLMVEEPATEYINVPAGEITTESSTTKLPEYMNFGPNSFPSPQLPLRKD